MITRKELIKIINNGVHINLNEEGNYCKWGINTINKTNKDPECGQVEKHLAYISFNGDIIEFNNYDELLDYKLKGISVYNRLKNEDADDLCTFTIDDNPAHGGPFIIPD